MAAILNSTKQARPTLSGAGGSAQYNAFYNNNKIWNTTPPSPNYFRIINAATIIPLCNTVATTFEYSLDNGNSWISIVNSSDTITTGGATCLFRATGRSRLYTAVQSQRHWQLTEHNFIGVSVAGDIRTLLDYQNPPATVLSRGFAAMFYNEPDLEDVSNLILPDSVQMDTYASMFRYCSRLASVPKIMLTDFPARVCQMMFQYCTSLNALPALRGTNYAASACEFMFDNCSSLDVYVSSGAGHQQIFRIPQTGTATSVASSFIGMFSNISPGSTIGGTPTKETDYYVRYIPQ